MTHSQTPIDTPESAAVVEPNEPGPDENRGGCGCVVGRRWYVAATSPGAEVMAHDAIKAKSFKTGVLPFLPLDQPRTVIRKNRVGRVVSRRTFPVVLLYGYCFVNFDVAEIGWRSLYRTPGVERLLGLNPNRPEPIDPGFIEGLMSKAAADGRVTDAAKTMVELGAKLEIHGHSWKTGRKGQIHEAPRVLVQIDFHGFAWTAWMPTRLFAELRDLEDEGDA